ASAGCRCGQHEIALTLAFQPQQRENDLYGHLLVRIVQRLVFLRHPTGVDAISGAVLAQPGRRALPFPEAQPVRRGLEPEGPPPHLVLRRQRAAREPFAHGLGRYRGTFVSQVELARDGGGAAMAYACTLQAVAQSLAKALFFIDKHHGLWTVAPS